MKQQEENCSGGPITAVVQQDECECAVHRLLRYIRTLTVYVNGMLGRECAQDELECDDAAAAVRGRITVPAVMLDCAAPCRKARKKCYRRPCTDQCRRAAAYFAQKTLPEQPCDPISPGHPTELVDLSLIRTDCMFLCCRGPEPATNRCVYRRLPPVPAPVPGQLPFPECCPCLRCKPVAEQGKNRCPLRKVPCEYMQDERPGCCDQAPGTCDCAAKRSANRDLLIARCADRLADIVCQISAAAEWRALQPCSPAECGDRGPLQCAAATVATCAEPVEQRPPRCPMDGPCAGGRPSEMVCKKPVTTAPPRQSAVACTTKKKSNAWKW